MGYEAQEQINIFFCAFFDGLQRLFLLFLILETTLSFLILPHLVVQPILLQQLVVCATLCYFSFLEDDDLIYVKGKKSIHKSLLS
jgi:hypothetical protein